MNAAKGNRISGNIFWENQSKWNLILTVYLSIFLIKWKRDEEINLKNEIGNHEKYSGRINVNENLSLALYFSIVLKKESKKAINMQKGIDNDAKISGKINVNKNLILAIYFSIFLIKERKKESN